MSMVGNNQYTNDLIDKLTLERDALGKALKNLNKANIKDYCGATITGAKIVEFLEKFHKKQTDKIDRLDFERFKDERLNRED